MKIMNPDGTCSWHHDGREIGTLDHQDVFIPKPGISFNIDGEDHVYVRTDVLKHDVHHWVFKKLGKEVKLPVHEIIPKLVATGVLRYNPNVINN